MKEERFNNRNTKILSPGSFYVTSEASIDFTISEESESLRCSKERGNRRAILMSRQVS
jgi:hypothetical protein